MKNDKDFNLLVTAFQLYNISKLHSNIYKNGDHSICKNLILEYYSKIKPDYSKMLSTFKRKYVSNEALVEKNDTLEERRGLSLVYDYIQDFNIEKENFNIFINSLLIHQKLFEPMENKSKEEYIKLTDEAKKLLIEAKKESNLQKLKKAQELMSLLDNTKFGGALRTEAAIMRDYNVEIPDGKEVSKIMNSYLSDEKKQEYEDALNDKNILNYISYCVKTTAYLIGIQPFRDGNKRTFRSLLNLMFKKRNLPPVYIVKKERSIYHDALEKAIENKDYDELITFYYYKICDSIYELDFKPRIEERKENEISSSIHKK